MMPLHATVGLLSPSHPFDEQRLAAGRALAEAWGLRLVDLPHLGARYRYLAGSRAERTADLVTALTSPDLDAAWYARGGSGTAHLLPRVPWEEVVAGRPVIGFSDATGLLNALARRTEAVPVHGPVLHSLADVADTLSQNALRDWIVGDSGPPVLPGRWLQGPRGPVEGRLWGGNLCVLASLCGTPFQVNASGGILLLEEIGEPAYKLDRLLSQLIQAGCLDNARGVALGSFTSCRVPDGADYDAIDVVLDVLSPLGLPVVGGLPVGHGPQNLSWPVGALARLDVDGVTVLGPSA